MTNAVSLSANFTQLAFADLPGWRDDDHLSAFQAFRRCAVQAQSKPYRTGSLGISFDSFGPAYRDSRETQRLTAADARLFFERHFVPAIVSTGIEPKGFVTGYYEPRVKASPVRTPRFATPLLARPDDLIEINDANRPNRLDPYLAYGRETPDGPTEYWDRKAIDEGAISNRAPEIAWLESRVDAFFIHVQGAAWLDMTDGSVKRVTYAAKSGHRFTSIGKTLADLGEISIERVTMQSIRAWLAGHPHRVDEILWKNRSYIFFREAEMGDTGLGPVAAAKVQLAAGRSLAVDRMLHTFGTPFYIDAPSLTTFDGERFRRLMIAQDTGSAIVGPARGDIFAGTGDAAGDIAGVVRNRADFYALLPRALVGGGVS